MEAPLLLTLAEWPGGSNPPWRTRMLSAELNERLTRVGPGTPAGDLLRRYWMPIAAVAELTPDRRSFYLNFTVDEGRRYRFGKIAGRGDWTLSLVGRNLKTWTNYNGFDPEVGLSGGTNGSGALNAIDAYTFPNLRTFTLTLTTSF